MSASCPGYVYVRVSIIIQQLVRILSSGHHSNKACKYSNNVKTIRWRTKAFHVAYQEPVTNYQSLLLRLQNGECPCSTYPVTGLICQFTSDWERQILSLCSRSNLGPQDNICIGVSLECAKGFVSDKNIRKTQLLMLETNTVFLHCEYFVNYLWHLCFLLHTLFSVWFTEMNTIHIKQISFYHARLSKKPLELTH